MFCISFHIDKKNLRTPYTIFEKRFPKTMCRKTCPRVFLLITNANFHLFTSLFVLKSRLDDLFTNIDILNLMNTIVTVTL